MKKLFIALAAVTLFGVASLAAKTCPNGHPYTGASCPTCTSCTRTYQTQGMTESWRNTCTPNNTNNQSQNSSSN